MTKKGPGHAHELPFTNGEIVPILNDHGVELLGQHLHSVFHTGAFQSFPDLNIGVLFKRIQIVPNRNQIEILIIVFM